MRKEAYPNKEEGASRSKEEVAFEDKGITSLLSPRTRLNVAAAVAASTRRAESWPDERQENRRIYRSDRVHVRRASEGQTGGGF